MAQVITSIADTAALLVKQGAKNEGGTKADKTPRGPSKADKAREIYISMPGASRKAVIARFVSECGLTQAGASTYYQNIKGKTGS